MMVQSTCPPGAYDGHGSDPQHYSKFVVTQVFDQNNGTVVSPNHGSAGGGLLRHDRH